LVDALLGVYSLSSRLLVTLPATNTAQPALETRDSGALVDAILGGVALAKLGLSHMERWAAAGQRPFPPKTPEGRAPEAPLWRLLR
jgi:hypothetical protein